MPYLANFAPIHIQRDPELARRLTVLDDVWDERDFHISRWGADSSQHPDGTSEAITRFADEMRILVNAADAAGRDKITWAMLLAEEFAEAVSEKDPKQMRKELIQVASLAVAWAEDLDGRAAEHSSAQPL